MRGRGRRAIPRSEERVFPPARRMDDGMLREHRARYAYVAPLLRGRVLDVGCGTGYGCHALSRCAAIREIVGLDRSTEAIEWAGRYYPGPNVSYSVRDLEIPGWERDLGRFDGVIAFEILEHLGGEGPFWSGIERLLAPASVLWLSTPLGRGRGIRTSDPYHVHQLRRSEVEDLFADGWAASWYGQTGTWIEPWVAGRRYFTMLVRANRSDRGRVAS